MKPVRSPAAVAFLALAVLGLTVRAPAAEAPKKTPELVEQGRASFAKYCSSCHGPNGEGDGPAASALHHDQTTCTSIRCTTLLW